MLHLAVFSLDFLVFTPLLAALVGIACWIFRKYGPMLLMLLTYLPTVLVLVSKIATLTTSCIGLLYNPTLGLSTLQIGCGDCSGGLYFCALTVIYWFGLTALSALGVLMVERVAFGERPMTIRQLALVSLILQMKDMGSPYMPNGDRLDRKLKSLLRSNSHTDHQANMMGAEPDTIENESTNSISSVMAQVPYSTETTTPTEDDQEASGAGYL